VHSVIQSATTPPDHRAPVPTGRVLLVRAGTLQFGIPLPLCSEVAPGAAYTPLPGSEPFVCGLINLRGRLVTVLDLGAWAGVPPSRSHPAHSVVILRVQGKQVGLAVDDVLEIVAIEAPVSGVNPDEQSAVTLQRTISEADGGDEPRVFGLLNVESILGPVLA